MYLLKAAFIHNVTVACSYKNDCSWQNASMQSLEQCAKILGVGKLYHSFSNVLTQS